VNLGHCSMVNQSGVMSGEGNPGLDGRAWRADGLNMRKFALLLLGLLPSCSQLVVPGEGRPIAGKKEAMAVMEKSAKAVGDPWSRYRKVEVAYDGEWTGIAKRVQPDLVDADFRKASVETYETRTQVVKQLHKGPGGTKSVVRRPGDVAVVYNGESETEADQVTREAAALVADAYTAFLFGSSWLKETGRDFELLEAEELDGEMCDRVQGRLVPGFGFSEGDRFIAWVGRESRWLRRLQFTINGLESTRGADVEVRFLEHWKAVDGSVWPGRFVEWVERPLHVKAHEWWMTGLKADGRSLKGVGNPSDKSR